jgi:uncharacterized membrane protein
MNWAQFATIVFLVGTKLAFLAAWIAGLVLAKGFWSTAFALFLPPWGWYLIVERMLG